MTTTTTVAVSAVTWSAPAAAHPLAALYDWGGEAVAFLVGDRPAAGEVRIRGIWPTANVWEERPGGRTRYTGYAVGAAAWREARADARRQGVEVVGTVHTHLYASAAPSYMDHRSVKAGEIGAVWHPRSGHLILYDGGRVLAIERYEAPAVLSALARLTVLSSEPIVDPWPPEWPAPGDRGALPEDADLVADAEEAVRVIDDPATDPGAYRIEPERIEALRQALAVYRRPT